VSVSLHKSEDGSHLVNYVQWLDCEKLKAAHHSPEFRKKWPRFGELSTRRSRASIESPMSKWLEAGRPNRSKSPRPRSRHCQADPAIRPSFENVLRRRWMAGCRGTYPI